MKYFNFYLFLARYLSNKILINKLINNCFVWFLRINFTI